MIEDIIPAHTQPRGLKLLTPRPGIMNDLPTVESHISFLPFVNFLKDKLQVTTGTRADFYRYLIRRFEDDPELLGHLEDVQLDEHEELLELLATVIFPLVAEESETNFTFSVPYKFNIFSYSEPFRKLFVDKEEAHLQLGGDMREETLKQVQCAMIYDHALEKFYGIHLNEQPEFVFPVDDQKTGMKRFFRIRYDRRFVDLHIKGQLPLIEDCAVCLNTFRILDLEQQLKTMPLDLFTAEGFAILVAEDVTVSESLERLKKILLRQEQADAGNIIEMKETIQALIGLNAVEIGLMPFIKINNSFFLHDEFSRHSLIGANWRSDDEQSARQFQDFIKFQRENPEPMPVTNVDETLFNFAPFLQPLYKRGIRSFLYYPMQNSDGLLGMLELASPLPNLLTQEVLTRLEPAIPLLSLAMQKSSASFNNRIEKMVKEKFTALQPAVEWKFLEAALANMHPNKTATQADGIIFENVYPLYGAIDIRNSSSERSSAIQKDLKEHLRMIDDILDKLLSMVQLPLLEGLQFKNKNLRQAIEEILLPEDEMLIDDFLANEVKPVFTHLQKTNGTIDSLVSEYFDLSSNNEGQLFHFRREYDQTLYAINHTVCDYLEQQDAQLQKSYPHYFEKYKTDGVEYNIYIGQSIAPEHPFDLLYLKNIRLWQLQSMVEVAKITHNLLPGFKVPLETTQLILAHNQPISISFLREERRFDVIGSYNIRYEIMKKRIDKAYIRNSQERLTQPGKISLVYSNQKEAQEYEEYICFLQSKSLLRPGIEWLDLEEMQGMKGLKALRVDINLDDG